MNLKEYYEHYLTLHKDPRCRRMHFVGQLVTIAFAIFVLQGAYWYFLPAIPFVIYPFAWTGHFLFEKNTPAAFRDPLKAKISDWLMFRDILLGRISL
jgi:hypothetical protein|tara:strand:- start:8634 stop:8924 length:291 start_codon:yes stop_codon:yes gene_type:complete